MTTKIQTIITAIAESMPLFERVKSAGLSWDREQEFAIQAITNNTSLQECTIQSIQDAIVNVGASGLSLNPADGYSYLVPDSVKLGGTWTKVCALRISFKGLIKSATDTGVIQWVKADVVKANDTFSYNGPCTMPTHTMNPFAVRGETVGAYCIAKLASGEILVDTIGAGELATIESCAKTPGIWKKFPDEMAKKAIIKRASKQWPKSAASTGLHETIRVINDAEGNEGEIDSTFQSCQKTSAYILKAYQDSDDPLNDTDALMVAGEAWSECNRQEQEILWTAKTKGGFFTQSEKEFIRAAGTAYKKAVFEATASEESSDD